MWAIPDPAPRSHLHQLDDDSATEESKAAAAAVIERMDAAQARDMAHHDAAVQATMAMGGHATQGERFEAIQQYEAALKLVSWGAVVGSGHPSDPTPAPTSTSSTTTAPPRRRRLRLRR